MELYDSCWLKKTEGIKSFYLKQNSKIAKTISADASYFFGAVQKTQDEAELLFTLDSSFSDIPGAFNITQDKKITISAPDDTGLLYGFYELLRRKNCGCSPDILSVPQNAVRMIDHWDNLDGSVERGYAGNSLFFENGAFRSFEDFTPRIEAYARMLASVGINAVAINNVNVRKREAGLLKKPLLDGVATIADIFIRFGIKIFLSVNFASPVIHGGAATADPKSKTVLNWWTKAVDDIFAVIPYFGGFIIKADSEGEPGPFAYGRDHSDGANCLANALASHDALLIWRCFVYNCNQDWRDRTTDRARAAYDTFKPLDGKFAGNVALQIKNGPVDFQVREPVNQLFGAMPKTNAILEFQITQEYTGQQKHICYLVPLWKEVLDFKTYAPGYNSADAPVSEIIGARKRNGIAAVSNIGMDFNWTGHKLAQVNLYGYGRLCWDTSLTAEQILTEWIRQSFELNASNEQILFDMIINSREIYEKYTAPLGVGWMCKPNHHYGPDVDGYEYDRWGTYHFADRDGVGVDRTTEGTACAETYFPPNAAMYNDIKTCPDELLLFFHHVPYTHVLKSGKTVIQHIYDTHFEGAAAAGEMLAAWKKLEGKIGDREYLGVLSRLEEQGKSALQWRDQINTYFYRKSGVPDAKGRKIY